MGLGDLARMSLAEAVYNAEPAWLTRKQAAAFLSRIGCPMSADKLCRLAKNGGPAHTRSGHRTIRYQPEDLRKWAERQMKRFE